MLEIPMSAEGGGRRSVDLGGNLVTLVTRYNYTLRAWAMDILDSVGADLLTGVMLYPGLDMLRGYPQIRKRLGALIMVESFREAHRDPNALGTSFVLLWFAPGDEP